MPRKAFLIILATLALAGCNRAIVPVEGVMPDRKPALATPPASMMTPQGY